MAYPTPQRRHSDTELALATLRLERAKVQLGPTPVRHTDTDDLSPEAVSARLAVLAAELAAYRAQPDDEG